MKTKTHGLPVHCGDGKRREFFTSTERTEFNRFEIIMEWLREAHYMDYASAYGEPGYSQPETGILFANWNNVPKAFQRLLEEKGYELEWDDEWTVDHEYDKAYRTSPDSYHWQPQTICTEGGERLTPDDSVSDWIDEMKLTYHAHGADGFPSRIVCLPGWITQADIEAEGYIRHPSYDNPDFEAGWFPGQNDDPQSISKAVFAEGNVESIVFRKTEQSQFYCKFECWVLYEEVEEDA